MHLYLYPPRQVRQIDPTRSMRPLATSPDNERIDPQHGEVIIRPRIQIDLIAAAEVIGTPATNRAASLDDGGAVVTGDGHRIPINTIPWNQVGN